MKATLSLKEQISLAKRLSFLTNSGITLSEGLTIVHTQARSRRQGKVLGSVLGDVLAGQSLSRSFSKFPKIFGDFTISILKVGESSGTLAASLTYLAEELSKKQQLRRKLVSAFIYPALITVATFAITAFLMLYLFPKIIPVFVSLHATLPLTTRVIMALSIFLTQWGLVLVAGVVVFVIATMFILKRSKWLRIRAQALFLRIPLLGTIVRSYIIANSLRTLSLLLRSGVRLSDAAAITAETTSNLVYRARLVEMTEVVTRGGRISTYVAAHKREFPDMISHLVAVGEQSGTLSETLAYLSDLYEREVDDFAKNISTLIEPILMIVMGLVVGIIALSIITPIYGITQNLHG